jgi:hypothetical protein
MATWDTVRQIALELPEVEESTWFGTPSMKVRGKGFCRLRSEAEGGLVVFLDFDEKEALLEGEPDIFFQTPHYENYPTILIRLDAIDDEYLREMLVESWRRKAPKRVLKEFDAAQSAQP